MMIMFSWVGLLLYCNVGGEENVRKAGKLYIEGPGYICKNYDILHFHVRKCYVF